MAATASKVALITGASAGIGKVAAERLAAQGWHLFLACRNKDKANEVRGRCGRSRGGAGRLSMARARVARRARSVDPCGQVIAEITKTTGNQQIEFLALDLASLASARQCAEQFLAKGLPLHLLINNAGLSVSGLTEDGFERQFQVNYLGHFLMTSMLLDRIKASAPARIINVGSRMYEMASTVDYEAARRECGWGRTGLGYAASKLAMVWHMQELKRRLEGTGVVVHTVHPGGVITDIYNTWPVLLQWLIRLVGITPEAAVDSVLNPALLPQWAEKSGEYFDERNPRALTRAGLNLEAAANLWAQSEVWTGLAPAAPAGTAAS